MCIAHASEFSRLLPNIFKGKKIEGVPLSISVTKELVGGP